MNNYESINSKQTWEPEELEFWELDDFVDVLHSEEEALEHDFNSIDSYH